MTFVNSFRSSSEKFVFVLVCFFFRLDALKFPSLGKKKKKKKSLIKSNLLHYDHHHHELDYWPFDGHNLDLNLVSADDDFCCSTEATAV